MPSASIWTILVCLWPFLTTVRPDVWLANRSFWRPFLAPNGIAIERIWSKSFIFWPLCDRFACYCGFICHFSLFLRWRRNRSGTWILGEWIFRTRLILTRLRRWTFARTGPVIPTQINKYWIIYTIRFKVYIYTLYRWTIWIKKYFSVGNFAIFDIFWKYFVKLCMGPIGRFDRSFGCCCGVFTFIKVSDCYRLSWKLSWKDMSFSDSQKSLCINPEIAWPEFQKFY